jgi:hypothetical protein
MALPPGEVHFAGGDGGDVWFVERKALGAVDVVGLGEQDITWLTQSDKRAEAASHPHLGNRPAALLSFKV